MGENGVLDGRAVLVTGAAGGIGRAVCRRFGSAGAYVGLADLDSGRVTALERELSSEGMDCLALPLDVSDEHACMEAVGTFVDRFGRLDILVNNAGITHRSGFAATGVDVYRRVMDVNYFGSIHCTKAALDPLLRARGRILVVSSVAGFAPLLGRTGYAASKHALHGLFDSLRAELKASGVGVTIICPGFTATGIDRHALDGDGGFTAHPQSTVGRAASPEQVAEAIFNAARGKKRLVVLSKVGRLTRIMTRCCPGIYERIMARSLRSELERDSF